MQPAWDQFWVWAAANPMEAVLAVAGVIVLFRLAWSII